jgi:hypothetical protein
MAAFGHSREADRVAILKSNYFLPVMPDLIRHPAM